MSENKDYTKYLPTEPPEGMISYLRQKCKINDECIVYRVAYVNDLVTGKKEKKVEVHCTACGETFYQDYLKIETGCGKSYAPAPFGFIHSETNEGITPDDITMCPCCCEAVKVYHCGQIKHSKTINRCCILTPYRYADFFALLGWCVEKEINNIGQVKIKANPYEGYIYEGKKCIKVTGKESGFFGVRLTGRWKQLSKCTDTWGGTDETEIFVPGTNLLTYIHRTSLENSKLDIYMEEKGKKYPITYLKLFQRHKNVENLIMQGAGYLVSEKIRNTNKGYYDGIYTTNIDGILWRQKQPSKMLGLSKTEFRQAISDRLLTEDISFYKEYKYNGVRIEDVKICGKYYSYRFSEIRNTESNVMKAVRYLEKQKNKYKEIRQDIGVTCLLDYWEMQKKDGEDVNNPEVRYTQNLVSAHNAAVIKMKYKEDKKIRLQFKKRFSELERYSFESEQLMIVPAKSEKQLHDEGKILHHCVGTYTKRHAEGETAIFFIRHKKDPEIPFFTLELDEKELKVRQNRGAFNCARTEEVKNFEEEWIEHIKKIHKEELENGESNDRVAV